MKIQDLKAYEVIKEEKLEDLDSIGYLLRHKKSGARISVISNDDENKVFYVAFRTPPEDNTGVPHIIEHTVLCSSKKFPVKDPFVELVKGSLNTFLNAITYSDKTVYPIASCNDKDFKNLMDVYMDAVFHPNIYDKEEIFKQEGWHYELEDKDAPITINGVVYNEMKGAFSSPEGVLDRIVLNSLYPDTPYCNESGGDPDCIPDLTYEDYLAFHKKYYHPSNSYIYLYGNMDIAERLDWLDKEYLCNYDEITVSSEIPLQEPFDEVREVKEKYSLASTESLKDNTYLSYNMSIGTTLDPKLYLAFDILDYALLSAPGAPLKKALLDAGIGKDIMGSYDSSVYQPIFSVVAKNANADQKEEFIKIIREVLEEQVANGVDKKALLAGINSEEFKFREADFGQFPKGLIYGLQCMDSWLYDDTKPFLHLEASPTFAFLKEMVDTDYFEKLIQNYMLSNTHVSVVMIEPEHGLNAKKEKELEEKLENYKKSLSEVEIEKLMKDTKHLKQYQEEPSPKEDLEKIPMLKREDMKKEAALFYNKEEKSGDTLLLCHEMFSNKINYVNLLFDVTDFTEEEIPYLGIVKAVLGYMDTKTYSYIDLANEINIYTGGISSSIGVYSHVDEKDAYTAKFEIRLKVLYDNTKKAFELIRDILTTTKIEDEKRLYEILAQVKSRLQMSLSSAGHSVSAIRAMSYFSKSAYFNDMTGGIALYRVVADYEEHFEEKKTELMTKIKALMTKIFCPNRLMVSITSEEEGKKLVLPEIEKLKDVLYPDSEIGIRCNICPKKRNEGFLDASKVQYVSRAGNFRDKGFSYTGALKILKVILSYDYLWVNVRVKGGAYGCMSGFMRTGDMYFTSYRDPNLRKTNEIYEKTPEYLKNFTADEREMTKYIIGTVSELDTPLNPYAKGMRSLSAYLMGLSYESVQKEREEVLNATSEDIRALSDLIAAALSENNLCVIGNEDVVEKEKDMFMHIEDLY
ncbi:MAG: insulinase family protein [Lachnospiraceae bacterium]|nr:insulinase family protein [Lachnospiraceae bacterium]